MKGIAVLGATGSVGVNTLDVIARHPDRYQAVALGAHRNVELLLQQIQQFRPAVAALTDPDAAQLRAHEACAAGVSGEDLGGGRGWAAARGTGCPMGQPVVCCTDVATGTAVPRGRGVLDRR